MVIWTCITGTSLQTGVKCRGQCVCVCVNVCLSVCPLTYLRNTCPNFTELTVVGGRGSVLQRVSSLWIMSFLLARYSRGDATMGLCWNFRSAHYGLYTTGDVWSSSPWLPCSWYYWYGMVRYGMVNVDLYSAIITKVSNALNTLVSGEKPGFQTHVAYTMQQSVSLLLIDLTGLWRISTCTLCASPTTAKSFRSRRTWVRMLSSSLHFS